MKIAIVGKIRSGKNVVGDYFVERYGCEQMAFADEIGTVISYYFPEAYKEGKPRFHYQQIGQFFRTIDPNVWIKAFDRNYLTALADGVMDFVVTDLRQPNEYQYLKENGFTIVKVEADSEVRLERMRKEKDTFRMEDLHHETESHVDVIPYDYLVTNNTTLEDLEDQLKFIADELRKGDF